MCLKVEVNKEPIDHKHISPTNHFSDKLWESNNITSWDMDTPPPSIEYYDTYKKYFQNEEKSDNKVSKRTLSDPLINIELESKSCMDRYFSSIEEGSLRGSMFIMISMALGTGCLTIPLQFKQMSLLLGMIVLILTSLATIWSLNIMIHSSLKYDVYDYSKVVLTVLGKTPAFVLDVIILIYIFGILISYQVISKILSI